LCFDCNDNIGTFKLHANACWAARAAEAASIVGGEEAWERMHKWLFEQGGRFTDQTFPASLSGLGFDVDDFIQVMMSDDTLQRVKAETNDGAALGIYFTPMVFVNGVEYLWYYGGQGSLESLVGKVAENVAAGSSGLVAPPDASEKLVEDWRRGRKFETPGHANLSWTGDGVVEVVVWGDYQAPLSAELDAEIQKLLQESGSQIKYAFRHFPVDELCNSGISQMPTKYNGSCYLAKLVEAVDVLGGNESRWKMHRWILEQQKPINPSSASLQAASLSGFGLDVIRDVVDGIEISGRMRVDIMAKNGVWRKSIPVVTIDGRFVPRWRSDSVSASDLFHRIVGVVSLEDSEEDRR
jgi:protein-disulfide isomerase